jgi:hypothetical protein
MADSHSMVEAPRSVPTVEQHPNPTAASHQFISKERRNQDGVFRKVLRTLGTEIGTSVGAGIAVGSVIFGGALSLTGIGALVGIPLGVVGAGIGGYIAKGSYELGKRGVNSEQGLKIYNAGKVVDFTSMILPPIYAVGKAFSIGATIASQFV